MALQNLHATAHPDGNRIDLHWQLTGDPYDGVRVLRRNDRFPEHPQDGLIISDSSAQMTSTRDPDVPAEKVLYYTVFPYRGFPPTYDHGPQNRVSAAATAVNGFGAYIYDLLPALYHRYDQQGYLRDFLQLTGAQMDQLYSRTRFSREWINSNHTPGTLLPLLAQWIGWRTDFRRPITRQRREITFAPALFQRIGLMPTLEATIKRVSGWDSRSKEYVHNIFASNRPPQLNLWRTTLARAGNIDWPEERIASSEETLLSMDFAYEGRVHFATDGNNLRWLFYHTLRRGRWEIWFKPNEYALLPLDLVAQLSLPTISTTLLNGLISAGIVLAQEGSAIIALNPNTWEITADDGHLIIERQGDGLHLFDVSAARTDTFAGSQPLVAERAIQKTPSAAPSVEMNAGDATPSLWLFWSALREDGSPSPYWEIRYRRRSAARWDDIGPSEPEGVDEGYNPFAGEPPADRRHPVAVSEPGETTRLWLFWLEKDNDNRWQIRYNRRDNLADANNSAWSTSLTVPLSTAEGSPLDLAVTISDQFIVLCWTRYAPTSDPSIVRKEVAYRLKPNITFDDQWPGATASLAKDATNDNHHDGDPFALFDGEALELLWSSNRGAGGWSIWHSSATLSEAGGEVQASWSEPRALSPPLYEQRAPTAYLTTTEAHILYRSSRHITYTSDSYRATETFDERYSGATSVDTRHSLQNDLRGRFEDYLGYTYDTGKNGVRDSNDRIARDTVGAFLENTVQGAELAAEITRMKSVIRDFTGIADRIVPIPDPALHTEHVYDYQRHTDNPRIIRSGHSDER